MSRVAVVVDVVRSPFGRGKAGGLLSDTHPVDLLAELLRGLVRRNALDAALVDDVLVGCVSQGGEQAATPGRGAVLAAGFPFSVPSATIDRRCGSGLQAVHFAAQAIMSGTADIIIAGGVESMSRVPMGSARMGKDPYGAGVHERFEGGLIPQGISAELVARRFGLTRDTLDAYALQSQRRAAAAQERGSFKREIVPIQVTGRLATRDETIRLESNAEALAALKPSFISTEMEARFGDIAWSVTAGNSSQIADGASLSLIVSETMARELGLRARARIVAFDVIGSDPIEMLTGPIESTRRVLRKAGLSIDQVDHFEVNEAFASVPLAWQREFGVTDDKLNPNGGAIALGHPLGASGGRLIASAINGLEEDGGRYALVTMCEAGGMANSTLIERVPEEAA